MAYGTHDFPFLDFGDQDINRIAALQTGAGVSFANILTAANNALNASTQSLDPTVMSLVYQTDQVEVGRDRSAKFQVEYGSEYAAARAQRGGPPVSHMLPIRPIDIATQWTEDYLDNVSEREMVEELQGLSDGFKAFFETEPLNALFSPTAMTVSRESSIESPKLIGFDTDDPAYGKISLADGTLLASPYSHYLNDTPANLLASIDAALVKLKARGDTGPFDIIGSPDAVNAISALDVFYETGDPLIGQALGEASANLDAGQFAGALKGRNVRVRHAVGAIQDGSGEYWFAVYKTFGQNDPGNVVGWRYNGRKGVTPRLRSRSLYPLDYATAVGEAGFGILNRFRAVVVNIEATANGYTAPTIRG
jgi:hypothetical protein